MAGGRRYRYVEFAARRQPGFRNRIVAVDQVEELLTAFGPDECFASVFRFSDEVLVYRDEHRVHGHPSIAGYDGRVWAPFLPLDIDAKLPEAGLGDALRAARNVCAVLRGRWGSPEAALHAFFSGARGFHILVDVRVFGRVAPCRDLHRIFSRLRLLLARELREQDRGLLDLTISDKTRLLRLAGTRHAQSGLYKVPLSLEELAESPAAEILHLAREPRSNPRLSRAGLEPVLAVEPVESLADIYARARRMARAGRRPHPYRFRVPAGDVEDVLCEARRHLWRAAVPRGLRNNAAIRLASALRLAGFSAERVLELLCGWNRRLPAPLPEREVEAVVRSAFARPYPYAYGCHDEVIRAWCPYVGRWSECDHPQRRGS